MRRGEERAWGTRVLLGEVGRQLVRLAEEEVDLARAELASDARSAGWTVIGFGLALVSVGAVAAGSIAYRAWRARRERTLLARGGRLREALGRMIDRPERVAVEPTATQRIIGSAGSAAAAVLIKAAPERLSRPRQEAWPRGDPRPS